MTPGEYFAIGALVLASPRMPDNVALALGVLMMAISIIVTDW